MSLLDELKPPLGAMGGKFSSRSGVRLREVVKVHQVRFLAALSSSRSLVVSQIVTTQKLKFGQTQKLKL